MFSEDWLTGFHRCVTSSALRKKYGINLDATDPLRKITPREAQGMYDYLLESGFSVGPSLYVLNMDKALTLQGLRKMHELLCRWPHPSELALLQGVLLSRLPEQYASMNDAVTGKKAGKLFSEAVRLLEEQARNRSYYVGVFDLIFGEIESATATTHVISMVVGKKGSHFARITHKYRLMYVWVEELSSGKHYRIYCYGRNQRQVRAAMLDIRNEAVRVSVSQKNITPPVVSNKRIEKLFFDSSQQKQHGGRSIKRPTVHLV